MACDMPGPCKFLSLDSCQRRFLWIHKEVGIAPHPVVGLMLQVGDREKFLTASRQTLFIFYFLKLFDCYTFLYELGVYFLTRSENTQMLTRNAVSVGPPSPPPKKGIFERSLETPHPTLSLVVPIFLSLFGRSSGMCVCVCARARVCVCAC